MLTREPPQLTVTVDFPDGPRDVPAHIESAGPFRLPRPVPDHMDGWYFYELIGGSWIARPSPQY